MTVDAIAEEVTRAFARRWPAWASEQGLTEHDPRLFDPSPEAYAAFAAELDAFLARLAPHAGDLDADALAHLLRVELFHARELALHRKNPDLAVELLDHVFPLLAKPGGRAPEAALDAVAARLEGAAAFLEAGRRRVSVPDVPPLWARVALESVQQAPAFLEAVEAAAAAARLPERTEARLEGALVSARDALAAHETWLRRDVLPAAAGAFAVGEAAFERLLAARAIGADAREVREAGERAIEQETRGLREAAQTVLASRGLSPRADPVREALEIVRRDCPASFPEALDEVRSSIEEARAFVAKHGLATLPETACSVVETPAFMRHVIPFAAYMDPGRWAAAPEGVYLVTPKADLGAFARADVRTTTVHEAWPGHHLQLSVARTLPLARFLQDATEYVEGWALYCEETMARHGYLTTPDERFVLRRDALWRALRIRLDVGLATGRTTFEEAVATLRERLGFSEAEAEAEVKRYTLEPGYNLSYMWGKLRFLDLRRRYVDSGRMTERAFHDAVLGAGALPFPLLERALAA